MRFLLFSKKKNGFGFMMPSMTAFECALDLLRSQRPGSALARHVLFLALVSNHIRTKRASSSLWGVRVCAFYIFADINYIFGRPQINKETLPPK